MKSCTCGENGGSSLSFCVVSLLGLPERQAGLQPTEQNDMLKL